MIAVNSGPISEHKNPQNTSQLQASLLSQQNQLLFTNLPNALAGTVIVSLLVVILFHGSATSINMSLWLLTINGITVIRLCYYRLYRSQPQSHTDVEWLHGFIFASWLSALAWGSCAYIFANGEDYLELSLVGFLLTGIAVVGLSSQIASLVSATGFLLISLSPMILRFLSSGTDGLVPASMLSLMIVILIQLTIRMHHTIIQNIRLHLQNLSREEALIDAEIRLANKIKQTPIASIEWDLEGRITEWNPSAEKLFGVPQQRALGKTIDAYLSQSNDSIVEGQKPVPIWIG